MKKLTIATRESKLAMAQAEQVAGLLQGLGCETQIFARSTKGDQQQDGRALAEWGYKGLFTKEIDAALLDGDADIAVHSMKDMPSVLPDGIAIAAVLKREDVRDVLLSPNYGSLDALPEGAVVGTASLRRGSQIKKLRPDLEVVPFRGNVQTRLAKLRAGEVDATLLALAGLNRLDIANEASEVLEPHVMLPAVAQGAIAITCRSEASEASEVKALLAQLNHTETELCVSAERAMLAALDGSCRTPIAGNSVLENGELVMRGLLVHPSGAPYFEAETRGAVETVHDAVALGEKVGASIAAQAVEAGQNFREWCK